MDERAVPYRSCVGCGGKRPKWELVRLVLKPEGQLEVDPQREAPGRGAYLCGSGCLSAAVKRKAFQRAFRGKARSLELESLEADLRRAVTRP